METVGRQQSRAADTWPEQLRSSPRIPHQLGAPGHVIARMLGNVALDGFLGAVPLVGDAFDVLWRANRRNVRLLQDWLERRERM